MSSFSSSDSRICQLVLEDGEVIEGISFGYTPETTSVQSHFNGEVVFTTGMVGYPEALTDPSYSGQILVFTTPMVGNYGVPSPDTDEFGLPKHFEGFKVHIAGLIVADYSADFSHWNATKSLSQWLCESGVPALYGIDTRKLTKKIRDNGSLLGRIEFGTDSSPRKDFFDPNSLHLVKEVSTKTIQTYGEGQSPRIIAFDCGMKLNIIRRFMDLSVCLIVVPFDYNLATNPSNIAYDGIFVSNGPGDPAKCIETIDSLRWALSLNPPKPIFGICLGNQLLALACGASTYKMKYGNRGMNHPCIDLRTTRCHITSQNHGFAVDSQSLPSDWKPMFLNANDMSNEGIIHCSKPYFSVQFHPEAAGGPYDTTFLFKDFVNMVNGQPPERILVSPSVYDRPILRKVLLVGSGGLSIGQAGEFDYSGSQAIKALKEEGLEVILINPNIATVQTSKHLGKASPDKVYFLPITPSVVEKIIEKERPDGVVVSMGGQTALNVGIALWKAGVFEKFQCRVLGTSIETIIATEDREIFSQRLAQIGEHTALSYSANTVEEAIENAKKIGYPILIRSAFALGGLGSGFAENEQQLRDLAVKAFATTDQILLDQDLRGWKEIEYEVVRDCRDNCITVCNMENFDPLGVHTGDSIVVAPSQTLSNNEYFKLRETSIKVIRSLGIIGECNIQYALNPSSEEYCIVEVNARLSRSSALASKATGYPLAYIAAKLCLGKDLVSIRNCINKTTTACFEPSLDYCVVKMPRWDLAKFEKVSPVLGSSMSSVGEVMAIGKTFQEAIQKAVRMVSGGVMDGIDGSYSQKGIDIDEMLRIPTDKRLFFVQYALEMGYTVDRVHQLSNIDRWFLYRLKTIADLKAITMKVGAVNKVSFNLFKDLKQSGFSDRQIARFVQTNELVVRRRRQQLGLMPFTKQIDTLAAEHPSSTNYLYMTYHGSEHDVIISDADRRTEKLELKKSFRAVSSYHESASHDEASSNQGPVIVLGSGAYSIGTSVEFDWCAVSAVRQLRAMGNKVVVINYNPETVSTDYDESDVLYFEELTLERVLDIYEFQRSMGVIVSVGGQIPNNLSLPLHRMGVQILGTTPESIDTAEDRHKFSKLLDKLDIDQPLWSELTTKEEVDKFAEKAGYPVMIRPSFVLSGSAMSVASTREQLDLCLRNAIDISADTPVIVSKYIVNAKEIEFDGVAQNGHVLNYAISEHVENAGVHSGDATLLLPAQRLYVQTVRLVKNIASQIALALKISGPFNIQFLAQDNIVKVIECNLRASRTFPFISKTFDVNFITLATKVMMGYSCKPYNISLDDYNYVAVKAPMFSFSRLRGADPTLGVEMSSTGEVACFGKDVQEAFLQALLATNFKLPSKDSFILVSIAEENIRDEFKQSLRLLIGMGFKIAATPGTAEYFSKCGFSDITQVEKPSDSDHASTEESVLEWIQNRQIGLVINIPEGTTRKDEVTAGYKIRRAAIDFGVALLTNIKCATLFCEALQRAPNLPCNSAEDYAPTAPTVGW